MIDGPLRKKLIVGVAAVAALAGGGGAIAASQLGSDGDQQAILNDAAGRLGVEPTELESALEKAVADRIDDAVTAGRLTKEQGDAIKARLKADGLPFFGGRHGDHGPGFGGERHMLGLDAAAAYLGTTETELHEALESGKSLAEIAGGKGKSVDGLKQAMVAAAKKDLDAAVDDGRLTRAQAGQILTELTQRIDDVVNRSGERHGDREPGFEADVFVPAPTI
jgi:polyhydroxyalkanoate synthesis regulator phasin